MISFRLQFYGRYAARSYSYTFRIIESLVSRAQAHRSQWFI